MSKKNLVSRIFISLSILIIGIYIILLAGEFILAYRQQQRVNNHCKIFNITEKRIDVAKRLGVKVQLSGRWWPAARIQSPEDFAIASFPNTNIIGFKEGDGESWPIHKTDRFGFLNKDEWWNDKPEILLVGDSFVSGEQRQPTNTLTSLLRARGYKAVNIAMTGFGPVLELASLRVYYPCVSNSVKLIVWVYYEGNDLEDCLEEYSDLNIRRSLDPQFTLHPNPARLEELPEDDWKLYGTKYAIKSGLSLKRVRLAFNNATASGNDIVVFQKCLDFATSINTNLVLIRAKKQFWNLDKQWAKLKAPIKEEMPGDKKYYSKEQDCVHYNTLGYNLLADKIIKHYVAHL